jgi:hypothetical protein
MKPHLVQRMTVQQVMTRRSEQLADTALLLRHPALLKENQNKKERLRMMKKKDRRRESAKLIFSIMIASCTYCPFFPREKG